MIGVVLGGPTKPVGFAGPKDSGELMGAVLVGPTWSWVSPKIRDGVLPFLIDTKGQKKVTTTVMVG